MTLIETIRADQLHARKNRHLINSKLLTTLIGETEAVGKKNLRAPNDSEVISVVKKFIKNNEETIGLINDAKEDSLERRIILDLENKLLNSYLPIALDQEKMKLIISTYIETSENEVKMGDIMNYFKTNYFGQYDGKELSQVVRESLS